MTATNNSYDVIVVGTGPAGSTAAHLLAAAGVRVALVDKATPPRYKTCGGGVIARARRLFATDITPVVERECRRVEINLLDAGLGVACERPHPIVSMTLRDRLDARLAEGAVAAGAELLAPCAVGAVRADAGGIALETACGPLVAALVVAAEGATGGLAGAAGWRANPGAIPAVEDEITAAEPTFARFAGAARFDFGPVPHGYAWVFPKGATLSVGALSTRRGFSGLRRCLADYLARLGIKDGVSDERHGYVVPLRPVAKRLVRHRCVLVGDAAGLADPVTAEGISFAALSGRLAAAAVVEAGLDERALRRGDEERVAEAILPHLALARAAATILYDHPPAQGPLFRRVGREGAQALPGAV